MLCSETMQMAAWAGVSGRVAAVSRAAALIGILRCQAEACVPVNRGSGADAQRSIWSIWSLIAVIGRCISGELRAVVLLLSSYIIYLQRDSLETQVLLGPGHAGGREVGPVDAELHLRELCATLGGADICADGALLPRQPQGRRAAAAAVVRPGDGVRLPQQARHGSARYRCASCSYTFINAEKYASMPPLPWYDQETAHGFLNQHGLAVRAIGALLDHTRLSMLTICINAAAAVVRPGHGIRLPQPARPGSARHRCACHSMGGSEP